MDTSQPTPDPQSERRQLIMGVLITVLVFAVLITVFTFLIAKSGGRGNYFNDIMKSGEQRQAQ